MCVSPNKIPNPYLGYKGKFAFMRDCVSQYINVPCGYCSECLHIKQLNIVQRAILECQFGYPFYCTLTYNNDSLPRINVNGRSIRYADVSDIQNMIKRLRKDNVFGRPFRYLCVSELGSKRGRPHFHLIFWLKKYDTDTVYTPLNIEHLMFKKVLQYWSRNYGSNRKPFYKPCCTYVRRIRFGKVETNYDLHYVVPSSLDGTLSDVPFYVTKYMLKPSDRAKSLHSALLLNLPESEYKRVWSLVKPRWFSSLNFGFGIYGLQPRKLSYSDRLDILSGLDSFKVVKDSISRSLVSADSPKFYSPDTGKSFPLSRYWRSFGNLYTSEDAIAFHYKNPSWREDNVNIDDRDPFSKILSIDKGRKQSDLIGKSLFDFDFD